MNIFQLLCTIVSCNRQGSFTYNEEESSLLDFRGGRNTRTAGVGMGLGSGEEDLIPPPLVYTDKGWVEGYFQRTLKGRRIFAFEGIPYGKAPAGKRRFRPPTQMDPWTEIKETKSKPPVCLQLDFTQAFRVHGSEDCLFLNVYSPKIRDALLPIIVFIHGGGYMCGTSSLYGPAYFLERDVILVTINFRVGVLGFLSTGDKVASGNWAMKDILLGLKWIQKNIISFGGDPTRVTIMGESSGAATVGLLVTSKRAEGLFNNAICQSGSALNHFSLINQTVTNSKDLASSFGCPIENSKLMMKCLLEKDPNWIVARSMSLYKELLITRLNFGPVVETTQRGDTYEEDPPFLIEAPEVSYAKGHVKPVPMIIGINQDEGALFGAINYITPFMLGKLNSRWDDLAPYGLVYDTRTNDTLGVSKKIKDFYFRGQPMTFWNRKEWMRAFGDRTIVQGTYYGMQHHSRVAPTYGYVFSFQNKLSMLDMIGLNRKSWGVGHSDELLYLFNGAMFPPMDVKAKDYQISLFLTNLWTNFATHGKPFYKEEENNDANLTDFWEPIRDAKNLKILQIDQVSQMIPMPFESRMKFWEQLRLKDDYILEN